MIDFMKGSLLEFGFEINFVEIGARGRVKDFGLFENLVNYVGFEPCPDAAAVKRQLMLKRIFKNASVITECKRRKRRSRY